MAPAAYSPAHSFLRSTSSVCRLTGARRRSRPDLSWFEPSCAALRIPTTVDRSGLMIRADRCYVSPSAQRALAAIHQPRLSLVLSSIEMISPTIHSHAHATRASATAIFSATCLAVVHMHRAPVGGEACCRATSSTDANKHRSIPGGVNKIDPRSASRVKEYLNARRSAYGSKQRHAEVVSPSDPAAQYSALRNAHSSPTPTIISST